MSLNTQQFYRLNPLQQQTTRKKLSNKETPASNKGAHFQGNLLMKELNAKAISSMPFLSFKGGNTTRRERPINSASGKAAIRKKANIVISKNLIDENKVKYTFTNVHYFENQLHGLRKNGKSEVIFKINKENKAIQITGDFEYPLAPMVVYSAIAESEHKGFKGNVIWNLKTPDAIETAYDYGFELNDREFHEAFKTNNEEIIRQKLYENLFNDDYFELSLPAEKVKPLKQRIIQDFKTELDTNPTFPILERGTFVPYPANEIFSISRDTNNKLTFSDNEQATNLASFVHQPDNTALITNKSNSDTTIKINGISVLKNEKAQIKLYDTIKLDNQLYMHTKEGLRLISDNAELFEELFPTGIQQIAFSQGAVGDCYLCASLQGLSLKPEGTELLTKLIRQTPEGNYTINFPGFPEEVIEIDLNDAVFKYDGLKSESPGLRLIEQGFGQLKKKVGFCLKELNPNDSTEKWLWYGFPANALYILTGGKQFYFDSSDHTTAKDYEEIYEYSFAKAAQKEPSITKKAEKLLLGLSKDFDNNIITVVSDMNKENSDWFFRNGMKIVQNHAYVVENIDEENRTLNILNPHQTWKPSFQISFDEFFERFTSIEGAKLPFRSDDHSDA